MDRSTTKEALEQIKEGLAEEYGKTEAEASTACTPAPEASALFQIAAGAIASQTILDLSDIPENMKAAVKQQAERVTSIEKMDETAMERVREFETKASQKVSDCVQFIVEPASSSMLGPSKPTEPLEQSARKASSSMPETSTRSTFQSHNFFEHTRSLNQINQSRLSNQLGQPPRLCLNGW